MNAQQIAHEAARQNRASDVHHRRGRWYTYVRFDAAHAWINRLDVSPELKALAHRWLDMISAVEVEPCCDCGDVQGDGHPGCSAWNDGAGATSGGFSL